MIVIAGLAAHRQHGVDRGRAAHRLAARIIELAAVEARLGHGLEHPVAARIADQVEIADRNVKPDPVVMPAGFQQQHALFGIGGQAVGDDAAGRARAHHDIIVIAVQHHREIYRDKDGAA